MENPTQADADPIEDAPPEKTKLRARDWLWRPRYAKLWWVSAFFYWAGMSLSFYVQRLQDFYYTALAGYLNVAFYPPVILIILGVGYIRAKFAKGDWAMTTPDLSIRQPERSVGGFLDPMADPLDPRFPLFWDR